MTDMKLVDIFDRISLVYSHAAQIAHLVAECGNLTYEAAKAITETRARVHVDYGLLGAMVSVEIALEQVKHNVLTDVDRTKMALIREARVVRMRHHTTYRTLEFLQLN